MTITVGSKGLDSADAVINEAAAFAAGSRFRFRYSAGAATSPSNSSHGLNAGKLCKPGEIAAIIKSGQDFIANDEWYATRVTEGKSAGQQDGAIVGAFWKSMGLPKGCSIIPSWDAAPNPALYAAVEAYLGGFNSELAGYYFADGLYAGAPALVALGKAGVIKHGWVPEAPSWSCARIAIPNVAPPAKTTWDLWEPTSSQMAYACKFVLGLLGGSGLESAVWQTGNHWYGDATDENVALLGSNYGSYLAHVNPAPPKPKPPTPAPPKPKTDQEEDMFISFAENRAIVFHCTPTGVRAIDPMVWNWYKLTGAIIHNVDARDSYANGGGVPFITSPQYPSDPRPKFVNTKPSVAEWDEASETFNVPEHNEEIKA